MEKYEHLLINYETAKKLLPETYGSRHLTIESYMKYKGPLVLFHRTRKNINDKIEIIDKEHTEVEIDGLLKLEFGSRCLRLCQYSNVVYSQLEESLPTYFMALIPEHLSDEQIESKILIEFRSFLNALVEQKLYENLESEIHVTEFLLDAAKSSPRFFSNQNPYLLDLERAVIYFFGSFGHQFWECIIGEREYLPDEFVNVESELELEKDILGKLWFDLDGLEKHWSKYELTKLDILHYAEIGKLELCYDYLHNDKMGPTTLFEYYPHVKKAVSPLIIFDKRPLQDNCVHLYGVSYDQESNLWRFAAISEYDVSQLITNGITVNPTFNVNGFKLIRPHPYSRSSIKLTANDLRITTREIRLFEKNILGLEINNEIASKTYRPEKPITPAQENSHLKVMSALIKTIEEKSTAPFTLDVLKFELEEKYGKEMGIKGFSKSSLDTLFAKANKALKDN
jgi:hypothetical protein